MHFKSLPMEGLISHHLAEHGQDAYASFQYFSNT